MACADALKSIISFVHREKTVLQGFVIRKEKNMVKAMDSHLHTDSLNRLVQRPATLTWEYIFL